MNTQTRRINELLEKWEDLYGKIDDLPGYPNPDPNTIEYKQLGSQFEAIRAQFNNYPRVLVEQVAQDRVKRARRVLNERLGKDIFK